MNGLMIELLLIAVGTAMVCALPGVFLLLRGASLMSDAISHALLVGIVGMFLLVGSLTSPWLLVGAGIAGFLVTVWSEHLIRNTNLTKDAAIGLLFPCFFSVAIILINLYARDVHLDADMVLLGDLVFAPFSRCTFGGYDCGSYAFCVSMFLFLLIVAIFYVCYRSFLATLCDPLYAHTIQAPSSLLYYGMMLLTSIVAVSVFSVVGSVIVVALMITPAAMALCTARSLYQMFVHALVYAVCAAVSGYLCAAYADVSVAGSIATMNGALCALVILCAPRTGLLGRAYMYGRYWLDTSVHLIEQYGTVYARSSFSAATIQKLYNWSSVWTILVLWYASFYKKITLLSSGEYRIELDYPLKDINL